MTIDINKLRRLAQEATPGPWVSQGRYIGTPRHMSYVGEVRDQCGNWSDTEKSRADAAFIAAANPAAVSELLDRLEAAEKERDDVAQRLVRSEIGKREISEAHNAVTRRLSVLADENEALRAKIAEMERQEPVALVESWANGSYTRHYKLKWLRDVGEGEALYALPGAKGEEK